MIFDIEFPARKGRQQMRRNKQEKDLKRELRKSFHTKTKRVNKPKYVFKLLDDSNVGGRVYTVFSWKLEKSGKYQITPAYTYPLNRGKVTDDKLAAWETGCLSSDEEDETESGPNDDTNSSILSLINPDELQ